MKKSLLLVALAALTLNMQAQPPADTTPTYPYGATYKLSDGTSVTKSGETIASSTVYYNAVQCTINETTGIQTISQTDSNDGKYYDLQGRTTTSPSKGIYVKNGKKLIVK